MPPDCWRGYASANSDKPTRSSIAVALSLRAPAATPASSSGKATLDIVDRHGSRRGSWKTKPTRGSASVTGAPPISIVPASGRSRPAMSRNSVLLPDPLGPTMATTSPSATSKLTPSTTSRWSPVVVVNPRLTASSRISASCASRICASTSGRGERQAGASAQKLSTRLPSPIRTLTVGSLPGDPPSSCLAARRRVVGWLLLPKRPHPPTTGWEFHPTPKERRIRVAALRITHGIFRSVLTILLTRHGHTERSEPEQYLGQTVDSALDERGRASAARLGERL